MLTAAPGTVETPTLPARSKDEIAVVVPVYMGKAVLRKLCGRLVAALEPITPHFSIVLVDDRSPDDAWPLIQELGREDRRIRGVQLSRNFGQHYALTAGIDHARADWYVVMDCDLQDAPEDIPLLYAKVRQGGFDAIAGVRAKEGHGFAKRHASRIFYAAFNLLAGFELDWSVGNFRIFSDRVADGFRQMREQMRLFPASLSFMGFTVGTLELPHHPREDGKSSYTFAKLARLAAEAILAHSQTPLKLATYFGLAMAVVSILAGLSIERRVHFLKKVLDPPGYAYTPGTPLHRGSRRVHRMRRRRGGGPATWARWSMARASASTLDGARGLSARTVSITPPPGHYEPGAVGLHRRLPKGAPTSGVGPDGGSENEPHKEPRGAPGDWHPKTL